MSGIEISLNFDKETLKSLSETKLSYQKQKLAIKSIYDTKDDLRFVNKHGQIHIIGNEDSRYYVKKVFKSIFCILDVDTFDKLLYISDLQAAFMHDSYGRAFNMVSSDVQTEHDMFTLSTLYDYKDLTFEDLKMCNELYKIFSTLWVD